MMAIDYHFLWLCECPRKEPMPLPRVSGAAAGSCLCSALALVLMAIGAYSAMAEDSIIWRRAAFLPGSRPTWPSVLPRQGSGTAVMMAAGRRGLWGRRAVLDSSLTAGK